MIVAKADVNAIELDQELFGMTALMMASSYG